MRAEWPAARPVPPPEGNWTLQGGLWVQIQERIASCLADFRRIVGMPDYAGYLRHLASRHPDWPVPTEREFFDLYVRARYGDGPTRCC